MPAIENEYPDRNHSLDPSSTCVGNDVNRHTSSGVFQPAHRGQNPSFPFPALPVTSVSSLPYHRSPTQMPSCRVTNHTTQTLNISLRQVTALHFENEVSDRVARVVSCVDVFTAGTTWANNQIQGE